MDLNEFKDGAFYRMIMPIIHRDGWGGIVIVDLQRCGETLFWELNITPQELLVRLQVDPRLIDPAPSTVHQFCYSGVSVDVTAHTSVDKLRELEGKKRSTPLDENTPLSQ